MVDLEARLREVRHLGARAFVPYVTGGLAAFDPDLLLELEEVGADALEVGIPFSDPIMDGGVIQEASRLALERGTRPADVLRIVKEASLSVPVAVMTYFNPILRKGPGAFLNEAARAGVSGVIVPDLPVDEAGDWTELCAEESVAPVFLAAPGSSPDRMKLIASAGGGFVYCVATYGVTGERATLAGTAKGVVEALRPVTDLPLLVGVGIGSPEQAAEACSFADGVIVGSALVRRLVGGDRAGALAAAAEFRAAIG